MRFLPFLFLVALICGPVDCPVFGQLTLEQGNIEAISGDCPYYCSPGVRNRSQSRGVVIRRETQFGFDWDTQNSVAGGVQRVSRLEQFTFKFKVPLVNKESFKALLGYEWDTEKYFFNTPFKSNSEAPTLSQLLHDRRLKANKLSAYVSKSWDEKFYTTARIRMSLNGDYQGLISFDNIYRTYSAAAAFGKKVSDDEEWAVGLTFSSNKARTIAIPFFMYNKTFNDRWGIQTALPGQAFIRHNRGRDLKNAFLLGPSLTAVTTPSTPGTAGSKFPGWISSSCVITGFAFSYSTNTVWYPVCGPSCRGATTFPWLPASTAPTTSPWTWTPIPVGGPSSASVFSWRPPES